MAADGSGFGGEIFDPGLVDEITRAYPSFPQQWVDDRTRALATIFLLRRKHPNLILTHLVDLDSEAHDQGPLPPTPTQSWSAPTRWSATF